MIILNTVGVIGILMMLTTIFIYSKWLAPLREQPLVDSMVTLLNQAINQFNRRILFIFIQFILISNLIYVAIVLFFNNALSLQTLAAFDLSLLIFAVTTYVMLKFLPLSLTTILEGENQTYKSVLTKVIYAGFFQTNLFFGTFVMCIYVYLIIFDAYALLALSAGILIMSFYYRSAGGTYKAAAENNPEITSVDQRILTHPAELLVKTGSIIASVGGYYLDIFGSWIIAIATFFVYFKFKLNMDSITDILVIPEIQWVLAVICCTGISTLCAIPYVMIRKKVSNIFLEVGYLIILLSFFQLIIFTSQLNILEKDYFIVAMMLALVSMLGIAFFTNFLTSSNHQPIQIICRQAQYGSANVLITSFFNGLIGNAVFSLVLLLVLFNIFNGLGIIGIIMIIIYALSIAVVACSIKVFSVIANQVISIIEHEKNPFDLPKANALKKVSYTLVAIGNSFSSAAGLLSSSAVLIPAISLLDFDLSLLSIDVLFGLGLGIITISIFYGASISGTYQVLISSTKEVSRQLSEIPQINEENKSHPNMAHLSDQHSLNGLRAVTLPGLWVLLSLGLIFAFTSYQGLYGALIGMFLTVFIQSFFWSIFGDSVAAAFDLMRSGRFGGKNTISFNQLHQAFLYAHYFQWVLAPTGVIIMKFVGIMALISALV